MPQLIPGLPYSSNNLIQPDLAIIIANWNAKEFLRQCLFSLYDTIKETSFEVWVIDNGSTDGSPEMVRKEFSRVNLICNRTNLGFAKANNIGIRKSESRYICLINSDVKVLDNCIDSLLAFMEEHPHAGILGPKILNPDLTLQASAYAFPTLWNSLTHSFGLHRIFHDVSIFRNLYNKYDPCNAPRTVEVLSGCFWLIRRESINKVGLLDEDFFMYMEDFDMCKRFHEAGWDVRYFPNALAIHYGGGSSNNVRSGFLVQGPRSQLHYWNKYYGKIGAFYITVLLIIYHSLFMIHGFLLYVYKPSMRNTIITKIRKCYPRLWYLLLFRHFSEKYYS